MTISPPPLQFDGKFSEFFERYVEPNLPSADRVQSFDTLLRRHLSSDNPIHVIRYVRGQIRGAVYLTAEGGRLLPTDKAPAWWLHALLLSGRAISANAEDMFASMPYHFFNIAQTQTSNGAGYHAAHILSAKNRNIDWQNWSRDELERRMLVNIHPCNTFLVAKQGWTLNGGRSDIVGVGGRSVSPPLRRNDG
jgi:hypothetical protein